MLDCAVIGAGLAGLTAARLLTERGLRVRVFEARDRVGGRVENGVLSDGQYVELGGQWIGAGHDALLDLLETYKLETIDPSAKGDLLVRLRGRAHSVAADQAGAELSPFEVSDLGQGLLRLRRLAARLRDDAAWRAANRVWLDQELISWVRTNLRTPGAQRRFAEVYQAAFGASCEQETLLQCLKQLDSGSDLEQLLASNGGLNQLRVAGGLFTLCQAIADELGDLIQLEAAVTKVEHRSDGATLVLADGQRIQARQVISTLPPRLAVKLEHEPALPKWRSEAADKVAAGNVIKAFLVYETPFWREAGLSGQSSADDGAVRVTFDTTTGDSERGLLMGFFEGADADSLGRRSVTLRQRAFTDSVVRTFGEIAANPIEYIERDWSSEEFTGGCHGAHFAPGIWTSNGPVLAEPEGVLHWAGAEYSAQFNGYLEGAVRSGQEVALKVARAVAKAEEAPTSS